MPEVMLMRLREDAFLLKEYPTKQHVSHWPFVKPPQAAHESFWLWLQNQWDKSSFLWDRRRIGSFIQVSFSPRDDTCSGLEGSQGYRETWGDVVVLTCLRRHTHTHKQFCVRIISIPGWHTLRQQCFRSGNFPLFPGHHLILSPLR